MLFNSYEFIFIFLVPVLLAYRYVHVERRIWFLVVVSVVFYAQWSLEHLAILLGSVCLNYLFALKMSRLHVNRKAFLSLMVVLNLLPLGYFKYANFLHISSHSLVLPLAISFFTFQQIAFGVDLYTRKIKLPTFVEYGFFVLFFPQLIAGPIVHFRELMEQVRGGVLEKFNASYFQQGIVLFSLGLFKKLVVADNLSPLANAAFASVDTLHLYDAWLGVLAYSFEIYFDFSAYADMALGLALLFGIRLPINFNSPYKSKNIIEFWRRWHITLSHFLRDYVYIPLGGNRGKSSRAFSNLMLTMFVGGLWHGAGWTFLLWGLLHGLYLGLTHLSKLLLFETSHKMLSAFGVMLTFLVVTLLWVLFRAENLSDALLYYHVLFSVRDMVTMEWTNRELIVLLSAFLVWFMPNSLEWSGYIGKPKHLGVFYAASSAVLFFVALKLMADTPAQTFVYFNF